MTVNLPVLSRVIVAKPCSMKWEEMPGDETVRHCDHCDLNVYNLSNMTSAEAENLITSREGRLCGTFYRRPDGTILTRDCPVGVAAARAAIVRTICRVSAVAAAIMSAVVVGRTRDEYGDHLSLTSQSPFATLSKIAGKSQTRMPMVPGALAIYPPPPQPKPATTWKSIFGAGK